MTKEVKIMIPAIAFTYILIVGFAVWQGNLPPEPQVNAAEIQGLETTPALYDVGTVKMSEGKVIKTFEIKNTTGATVNLKKIATSCMCTKAKVKVGDRETKEFGMEG